tara:strand:+ start:181 stop:843 length:663 start_codon:yes stop_codon:yes gene_type:complete
MRPTLLHKLIIERLKKHVHVVDGVMFTSDDGHSILERFIGKHPLLKPEMIVINDQPYGFKRLRKEFERLENYPIYCELEYTTATPPPDDEAPSDRVLGTLLYFDLYTEIPLQKPLKKLPSWLQNFLPFVSLEHIQNLASPDNQSLIVCSRFSDKLDEEFADAPLDLDIADTNNSGAIEAALEEALSDYIQKPVAHWHYLFDNYLKNFLDVIKQVDERLIH